MTSASDIPSFQNDGWLPPGRYVASWDDVIGLLRNGEGSKRALLTDKLLQWKDELIAHGLTGSLLIDGSYVSAKETPSDLDVLLVARPDVQALKDMDHRLQQLLDHGYCQTSLGFSVFYFPEDSTELDWVKSIWDYARDGTPKGVLEVSL